MSEQPNVCTDCGKEYEIGDWPFPCKGRGHSTYSQDAQIHESEKAVVLVNPNRPDQPVIYPDRSIPVDQRYYQAGYVQQKLETHTQVRQFEQQTGLRMVNRHYDKNSARFYRETAPKDPPKPKDMRELVKEQRQRYGIS